MNHTTANTTKATRKPAKYPGYRTMTGAQRYNARMHGIFEDAYAIARAEGKSSPWDKTETSTTSQEGK